MSTLTPNVHIGNITAAAGAQVFIVVGDKNNIELGVDEAHGALANHRSKPTIRRHQLNPRPPRAPRGFVGRERESSLLEQSIIKKEAVILHGRDGTGKTTLVKKVANSKPATNMPDGVIYFEAVDENGEALGYHDIVQTLFDSLFESNPPYKVSNATARSQLSNTRPLVVLDRFSLPLAMLKDLPDLFPKGSVIVASQTPAMDTDEFKTIALDALDHQSAVQLFALRSGLDATDPDLSLAMDQICRLLHDFPLAITVTANLVAHKLTSIQDTLNSLRIHRSTSPDPIQDAVDAAYGLSYALLNTNQQDMLAHVAAAPGISVDRAWLENTVGGAAVSKSLEEMELLKANSPRLRLPEGLRPIVQAKRADLDALRTPLLNHLLTQGKSRSLDFEFIADELGNILGFIQGAFASRRWQDVISLTRAIDPFLMIRGLWDVWEQLLNLVLRAAENLDDRPMQAWALHQLGSRDLGMGDVTAAHRNLVRALRIRESTGDTLGAEVTRHNLGQVSTIPPSNGRGSGGGINEWLRRNLGWVIPGGAGLIATAALLIYQYIYLPVHPLGLSIREQPMLSIHGEADKVHYDFDVTNRSKKPVEGPLYITGNVPEQVFCPDADRFLAPSATLICSLDHPISSSDKESGQISFTARAETKDRLRSNSVTVRTKIETPLPSIQVTVTADATEYATLNQLIRFTFTITNDGNTVLAKTQQFPENSIAGQIIPPACDQFGPSETLLPHQDIICTAEYLVTQKDIDNGSITVSGYAVVDGIESERFSFSMNGKRLSELSLNISAQPTKIDAVGQIITFNFAVANKGNHSLQSIIATASDDPSKTICQLVDPAGISAAVPAQTINCTSTHTVTLDDIENGGVTMAAVARSGEIVSNVFGLTVVADQHGALEVAVTANPTTYGRVGEAITYTYVVNNTGNMSYDAGSLRIADNRIPSEQTSHCGT